MLRAGTTVLPMQAEHPSLFVQWVGEGAVGRMRSVCSRIMEGWAAVFATTKGLVSC